MAMLWVSHIQIRHEEVISADAPFNLAPWHLGAPPPTRSKAEAFRIATDIARQAQEEPARFAELARKYSEDITTADAGGMLGGLTALHFSFPPEVLDAFVSVRPGEVTRVLESDTGYHICYRHAPPPEQQVSGARIVLGYEGADWLKIVNGGTHPKRTRAESLVLAQSVYEEASAHPDRFAELVERHSEHPDRARGGDFGSWSTRQAATVAREVALLKTLKVGQIASPLDSPVGFEIILRTPVVERKRYAMSAIKVGFEPELSDEKPGSKAWARARALEFRAELKRDPSQFERIQAQHCCLGTKQWTDGQDEPGRLTAALSSVGIGEIPSEPVEHHWTYVVPKRLDPAQLEPTPPPAVELPSPEHIDMADLMRRSAGSEGFVREHHDTILSELDPPLALDATSLAALQESSSALDRASDPEVRVALFNSLDQQVHLLVGGQEHARYVHALYEHFERIYLRPPDP
jgi:hypothetical protein